MREDDGIRVALKRPGRRKVPDGFEGIIFISKIMLAVYSEVELILNLLGHGCAQRVRFGAGVPNVEGITLNRRELWFAKKARDVEHLTYSADIASGSTLFSRLPKCSPVGLTQMYRWRCKYSFVCRSPLRPS